MDYNRNLFNRFGDDLCELLLSYLPLNDCFQYECVSQQWKRLIFNKQNKLEIKEYNSTLDLYCIENLAVCDDYNDGNETFICEIQQLQHVLNKCQFISDLRIKGVAINDGILDTISNNCQHLKAFECDAYIDEVTKSSLDLFAEKCGQKLEIVVIKCEYNQFKLLVNAMPNVKIIRFESYGTVDRQSFWDLDLDAISINSLFITTDNKPVLPKLEEIDLGFLYFLNGFESFADMYCKQIKRLKAVVTNVTQITFGDDSINILFTQLNRFENLEKLELGFEHYFIKKSLESDIRLIGEKCAKLIDLRLDEFYGSLINCFANNFVALRKLQITYSHTILHGSVECFKSCIHLTHLSLQFNEDLSKIDAYLPKLEYLQISGDRINLTDNTLRSVAQLRQLYCFKIDSIKDNSNITDNGICYLINNCASIKCIEIHARTENITQKSVNEFISKAKQFPKIEFHFSVRVHKPNQVIIKDIPKNVRLDLSYYYG